MKLRLLKGLSNETEKKHIALVNLINEKGENVNRYKTEIEFQWSLLADDLCFVRAEAADSQQIVEVMKM